MLFLTVPAVAMVLLAMGVLPRAAAVSGTLGGCSAALCCVLPHLGVRLSAASSEIALGWQGGDPLPGVSSSRLAGF